MTKTKTKRTIWTILIIVATLAVAAFFYTQNGKNGEPDKVLEDVTIEDTVKAEEQPETNNDSVVNDSKDNSTKTNTTKYISDYQKTKNGFNAIGISWQELDAKSTDVAVYIRAKKNNVETEWFKVEKILEKTISGVAYFAAETPVLVEGDQYQYKITFKSKDNEVRNVEINIINTDGATETNLFQKLSRVLFGTSKTIAAPTVIGRSGWGAGAPNNTKAELQAYITKHGISDDVDDIYWPAAHASKSSKFIVHHTAGQNNPTNPAAAVRAIWVYHTFSRNWGDIGYNYLVDQYGKIYEGRFGGDHVIAGHSAPYNYDEAKDAASIGVSVLGDFSTYTPNTKILSGLSKIIGYKSYLYNISPTSTSKFEDKSTYNIAGHRNYTPTACPGAALYAKLPTVRTLSNTEKSNYGHTVSGFRVNNVNPVVGDTISAQFTIKNTSAVVTTLQRLKVQGRYNDISMDFNGFSNIVLQPAGEPGDSYVFNQARAATAAGIFDYYITYQENNSWRRAIVVDSPTTVRVTVSSTPYNVKMTTSLKVGPEFPVATAPATGTFTLENLGEQSVTYDRVKIVTRDSSGQFATSSWAYSDVEIKGKTRYTFSRAITLPADTYALNVEYYKDGAWESFVKNSGVADSANLKIFTTPAQLLLKSGLDVSKNNALVGEPIRTDFTIANNGTQPIRLSALRAYGTNSNGAKIYFPATEDLVLCKQGLVASYCDHSGDYKYQAERSFSVAGDYSIKVSAISGGVSQPITAGVSAESINTSATITVKSVNYKNIVLKVFKTNDATPAIGQPTTVTYRLYNNNSYNLTFDRIKIDGRLSNGGRADFLGLSNYTIPANSYLDRIERRVVDSPYGITYKIAYYQGGAWRTPVLGSGIPKTISATPHSPNIKINYSLNVAPAAAIAGSTFTTTFKIKNYEKGKVYIKSLKAGHRVNYENFYFSGVNVGIPAGSTITYTKSKVINEGVNHAAFITYKRYDGKWIKPPKSTTGIAITDTFKVYIEAATIEGTPLPASSGNVSVEQHLNLVAKETASQHYDRSKTPTSPTWIRNGMAGGWGAFGMYAPVADERYYINMRWNYEYMSTGLGMHGQPVYQSKSWYYRKRVVVTNPLNGKKVVCSIIEYGPGIMTRVAGLSPEAMYALGISGINNNKPLNYKWAADQGTPLGPAK